MQALALPFPARKFVHVVCDRVVLPTKALPIASGYRANKSTPGATTTATNPIAGLKSEATPNFRKVAEQTSMKMPDMKMPCMGEADRSKVIC